MRKLQMIKNTCNFFAPDGTIYSKTSAVEDVMQFSSFRIRVDEEMDYNVHYTKSVKDNIIIQTP